MREEGKEGERGREGKIMEKKKIFNEGNNN